MVGVTALLDGLKGWKGRRCGDFVVRLWGSRVQ